MGDACNLRSCPNDCSQRGYCINGTCDCIGSWRGADCSVQPCPNNCSGIGVCTADRCYCPAGYTGDACQTRVVSARWSRSSRHADTALLPSSAPGGAGTPSAAAAPPSSWLRRVTSSFLEVQREAPRVPRATNRLEEEEEMDVGVDAKLRNMRAGSRWSTREPPPNPDVRHFEVEPER